MLYIVSIERKNIMSVLDKVAILKNILTMADKVIGIVLHCVEYILSQKEV
ncbi:hypothetical protein [Sigmofec virus UA08Rod_5746]|uniref:Uncharacterized protein n=1 Tax=Sigmofec virus UA08Rod_5746 TaxID=2929439 RepID=A0A976N0J1_9VIRU|nr:hypothetical protein [Sigmofec virus UA08Rod_5746]